MAEEVVMPRLSDTMERGTIARWLVHEGDAVHEGDVLAEIETDKATMELNAYAEGVLLRILVQDGEAAELGAPIAVDRRRGRGRLELLGRRRQRRCRRGRRSGGGTPPGASAGEPRRAARRRRGGAGPSASATPGSGDLKASPVARRIASDAGFDLRALAGKGSGPDGRIVRIDVGARAGRAAPPAAAARRAAPAAAGARRPAARGGAATRPRPTRSSSRARCCAPSRGA